MDNITLSLTDVDSLTFQALTACNTNKMNARSVTASVVAAESDGIHSHGLARLPTYCEHAKCGKIDGNAQPALYRVGPAAIRVDAKDGFAHPAIDIGFKELIKLAKETAIAGMAVTNSYNCGVVGYHVERLASNGLLALAFVNAPASMAPWGGKRAVFGTNPITCGIPRRDSPPVIIDQASSVIAKSELIVHARQGEKIPEGWALDSDGNPTSNPKLALDGGTMVPLGKHKGAGYAFIVETLAAGVTGANFAFQASSFADNEGGSPRTGQLFIALNPNSFLGADFTKRIETLISMITSQKGAWLHGDDRLKARKKTSTDGVTIAKSLYDKLLGYADG
jgi:(2R)-3-sulfolactate dehydrogenase (NADP+)